MRRPELFKKILIDEPEINTIVKKLANDVSNDYIGKVPILVGILKGCHPFLTDFMREMTIDCEVDYMDISSYYGGTKSKADLKVEKDLSVGVKDRDVIIVDEIIDSGKTIKYVIDLLKFRGAKSVKIVTFIDKKPGRKVELEADYTGYTINEKLFLIGYGLDYNELYRNVTQIGVPKDEIIK